MKRAMILIMVFAFVLAYTTPIMAMPEPVEHLKDGVVDIITSPLQVTDHVVDEYEASDFKPFGILGGFMKGSFYMVKQAGTGLVDIVTIPYDTIKK